MASRKLSSDTSLASSFKLSRGVASVARPSAPTIGTATDTGYGAMSVTFTASTLGPTASSYTLTSSSGVTGAGASSPLTLQELATGTYTYTVYGTNANGNGPSSSSSTPVTVSSVWQPSGAYDSIATVSGTGSSGTISFTSIPSTYTHLQIRFIGRATTATSTIRVQFNSDTGSNYANHMLYGEGSAVYAANNTTQTYMKFYGLANSGLSADIVSAHIVDVLDYTNTNKNKVYRTLGGFDANGSGEQGLFSGLWMSTSAITSIDLITNSGSWTSSSSFALYGIKGN